MTTRSGRRIRDWLHRKGIMRTLNSSSASNHDRGRALIEVRTIGERLAGVMAKDVVRHSPSIRADWDTIRVFRIHHIGRGHYYVTVDYLRIRT